ncbi:hypothetical protein [Ornithinibacillus halotolerans]|uniref:hypothetical protein n=1 Tax=Ornithinibacillus halotolerans TaxID=1274357 RepID=UPI00166530B8|nr:hypothetical protein [Ornithinibacillus halotolerans]
MFKFILKRREAGDILEIIILLGIIVLIITGISIEVTLKKMSEQNSEIIDLLKQLKEK